MPELLRVGVLASGRGSNFQALVEAARSGRLAAAVVVLISDRAAAPARDIARGYGIEVLFVDPKQYPNREAHPGLHAQRQALEHGVRIAGATVHFVDEGVDTGPIVLQAAVPVLSGDTEETLSGRILVEEHRIYPEAVRLFAEGRLSIEGRSVHIRESP